MDTETKYSLIIAVILSIIITVCVYNTSQNNAYTESTLSDGMLDVNQNNEEHKDSESDGEEEEKENENHETSNNDMTDTSTTDVTNVDDAEKEHPKEYDDMSVPTKNGIKSYMDYRCITSKSSKQYALQKSLAYTGEHGIRMVGDRFCVALGSYYTTTIGQHVDIELKNGKIIKGILADCKDDAHTDSTNRINPNGSVVEFVVDTKALNRTARIMGDISYVNGWKSKIVNIRVYDKIEKF